MRTSGDGVPFEECKVAPSASIMAMVQSKYVPDWVSSPPAGHAEFLLQQISPTTSERKFDQKAILFGRVDKVCDVVVNHVSASRVHACVAFDEAGALQIADLGSTHGTESSQVVALQSTTRLLYCLEHKYLSSVETATMHVFVVLAAGILRVQSETCSWGIVSCCRSSSISPSSGKDECLHKQL